MSSYDKTIDMLDEVITRTLGVEHHAERADILNEIDTHGLYEVLHDVKELGIKIIEETKNYESKSLGNMKTDILPDIFDFLRLTLTVFDQFNDVYHQSLPPTIRSNASTVYESVRNLITDLYDNDDNGATNVKTEIQGLYNLVALYNLSKNLEELEDSVNVDYGGNRLSPAKTKNANVTQKGLNRQITKIHKQMDKIVKAEHHRKSSVASTLDTWVMVPIESIVEDINEVMAEVITSEDSLEAYGYLDNVELRGGGIEAM